MCHQIDQCSFCYIAFTLTDEAGRDKNLRDDVTSKLKVNWTPKLGRDVVNGKLPDVKVRFLLM